MFSKDFKKIISGTETNLFKEGNTVISHFIISIKSMLELFEKIQEITSSINKSVASLMYF